MPSSTINPWLEIPASDYEGHMNSPNVNQLKLLNSLFKEALKKHSPKNIAVPGCATGNGFEHIDYKTTEHVLALDINPGYLSLLRQRYLNNNKKLQIKCADINSFKYEELKYNLFYCALVFEYVDVPVLVRKIASALAPGGILSVLLQLPDNSSSPVSKTKYESLKKLNPLINLVPPERLSIIASKNNLNILEEKTISADSGKQFWYAEFKK